MECPQTDLEHLTVKITLYILIIYSRGTHFPPFRSTSSRFQDARLLKLGNFRNVTIPQVTK